METARIKWISGDLQGELLVEVVYSARKTMGLEIKADGAVIARMPAGTPDPAALRFLKQHQQWIVRKWMEVERRQEERQQRPLPDYITDPEKKKLYRSQAREVISRRAAYFAPLMGVSYNRIAIKETKTRWGSCSAKGNLNFHWKLILMPAKILDYVVVHELAHLKEMNHSPRFWAQVEKMLPDYRQRRKWLKEHGAEV